jgi:hypothetical protein
MIEKRAMVSEPCFSDNPSHWNDVTGMVSRKSEASSKRQAGPGVDSPTNPLRSTIQTEGSEFLHVGKAFQGGAVGDHKG